MLGRTIVFLLIAESAEGFMGTCCSSGVQWQANFDSWELVAQAVCKGRRTFDSRSLCLLVQPLSTKGRLGMWNIRGNKMADVQLQGGSAKAASHDHSDPTDIDEIWMYFANKEIGTRHLIRQPQRSQSIRWWYNLWGTGSSRTLFRISSHLVAIVGNALICWLAMLVLPHSTQRLVAGLNTSTHALLGGALGLLLVLRTNSAYGRFSEARKIWSSIISSLRELARHSQSSLTGWDRDHFLKLLAAFPPILLLHLRSGHAGNARGVSKTQDDGSDGAHKKALLELLSPADVDILWPSRNRPLTVVGMLGAIALVALTDSSRAFQHLQPRAGRGGEDLSNLEMSIAIADLESVRDMCTRSINKLTAAISNSEGIVKTTVPQSYAELTSRFLSVWCFTLPWVLLSSMGWRMVPCVGVIAWALLSIEEVGNMIEDPFNLPLLEGRLMPKRRWWWMSASGMHGGPSDELQLERSFRNIRGDLMDLSPANVEVGGAHEHLSGSEFALFHFHYQASLDHQPIERELERGREKERWIERHL